MEIQSILLTQVIFLQASGMAETIISMLADVNLFWVIQTFSLTFPHTDANPKNPGSLTVQSLSALFDLACMNVNLEDIKLKTTLCGGCLGHTCFCGS